MASEVGTKHMRACSPRQVCGSYIQGIHRAREACARHTREVYEAGTRQMQGSSTGH